MGAALLLFSTITSIPSNSAAQVSCGPGRAVLEAGMNCPNYLQAFAVKLDDADGRPRKQIFVRYDDPNGETVYLQILRGARLRRSDDEAGRYAIDICAYGSGGVEDPLIVGMGTDHNTTVCCLPPDAEGDDGNDEDDEVECPPVPLDYPVPLVADRGSSRANAQQALRNLVALFDLYYPWQSRWTAEYEEVAGLGTGFEETQAMLMALSSQPRAATDDITVSYGDGNGGILTSFGVATGEGERAAAQPRNHTGFNHALLVFKAPMASCGNVPFITCEHSAVQAWREEFAWGWEPAWYKCNHGRCPWGRNMRYFCGVQSHNYIRGYHVHIDTCNTTYQASSIYGHNCNDDSNEEYYAVRNNFHSDGTITGGPPCYDTNTNNNTDYCY
jgi:hypothetical protein